MAWRLFAARHRRRQRQRQRLLPFQRRAARRERRFKLAILVLTGAAVIGMVVGTPVTRIAARAMPAEARWAIMRNVVGLEPEREEVRREWDSVTRQRREIGRRVTEQSLDAVHAGTDEKGRRFLDLAAMAPDSAIVRWGDYNRTLLLSSKVFENDETGRSFRLKPDTHSVWLREVSLPLGFEGMVQVPDTPDVRRAAADIGAILVAESVQRTNSWGFRGPEPKADADLRGMILGDSFMQGELIGDDDTPPVWLEKHLRADLGRDVSILNTGTVGYAPEQYYYTFKAYLDRFRPHFVVISVFANDFGAGPQVFQGEGEWEDSSYWITEIQNVCKTRNILCLLAPVPVEKQIRATRREGNYPAPLTMTTDTCGLHFVNPIEEFVNEHLRRMQMTTKRPDNSPLFNGHIKDGHFSAVGAEVWGRTLSTRLSLLLRQRDAEHSPSFVRRVRAARPG